MTLTIVLTVFLTTLYFWIGFGVAKLYSIIEKDDVSVIVVAVWPLWCIVYSILG